MALWGNKDNVGSGSTVTLDYDNKVVSGWAGTATGAGTTFGQIGAAKTGDIISFGQHGSGTYFGEAVIVSIASSLQCTIASTEALSGAAIAGVDYSISEKPVYTLGDSTYNVKKDASPSIDTIATGEAEFAVGVGSIAIPVVLSTIQPPVEAGDYLVNNSDNFEIINVGLCTSRMLTTCITGDYVLRTISPDFLVSGETTVGLGTTRPTIAGAGETTAYTSGAVSSGATVIPLTDGNKYHIMAGDVVKLPGIANKVVYEKLNNSVTLTATVTAVASGAAVTFVSDTINIIDTPASADLNLAVGDDLTWQGAGGGPGDVITLDSGVTAAISADATLTFKRRQNGYDAYVYGVSGAGVGTGTQYETSAGWVGVTTYMDNDNNLRVKKEVLVAMSGITTGNPESYPPE
jgi:hypothetical protein